MHAFAHGSCIVRGSIPKAGEEKKSNMIGIAKAVSLGMSALLLVVALSFFVPAVLASIVAILATAVFVSYKVLEIYSKKNSNHNKVLNKKNAVEQILAANGLSPLDDEEKQKFKAMYKKGHKKQMTLSEAFAWVLYVMGIIMYFVNY